MYIYVCVYICVCVCVCVYNLSSGVFLFCRSPSVLDRTGEPSYYDPEPTCLPLGYDDARTLPYDHTAAPLESPMGSRLRMRVCLQLGSWQMALAGKSVVSMESDIDIEIDIAAKAGTPSR